MADDYHDHPALSYSTGKALLRSPAHYMHALTSREESSTFDVGHAIHSLVLGIAAFAAVILPAIVRAGMRGIE